MQVVIDIDEKLYERITVEKEYYLEDGEDLCSAIENGVPVPKGHGKIIAEPTEEDIAKTVGGQNDFTECIREAVKAIFDSAPTIIEADRREE